MRISSLLAVCACLFLSLAALAQGPDLSVLTNADTPFRDGDRVVCFGDSITQFGDGPSGYVGLLRGAFAKAGHPAVTVINAGISGHKVPDLQARLERDVLAKDPTIVFIYIGINDVWHHNGDLGAPKERFEKGLREIITTLQQRGIVVVLATPTMIGEKVNGGNPLDKALDAFSDTSRALAKELHVELCDLRAAFTTYLKANNPEDKHAGILTGDTVHLSGAGNALVAQEAAKSLVNALKHAPISPVMKSEEFIDTTTVNIILRAGVGENTKDVVVRYTKDGTEPTAKSPIFTEAFTVKETTNVKARAFRKDEGLGFPISATYTRLVPHAPVALPAGAENGLAVEYYEGNWPLLPDFAKLTPVATTTATAINLTPRKRAENYALRFAGYLEVPATGIYTFTLTSDDGSRLIIDEATVVNNDGMHGTNAMASSMALEKGVHAITITFMQGAGGDALYLTYSGPGIPAQPLPAAGLCHAAAKP